MSEEEKTEDPTDEATGAFYEAVHSFWGLESSTDEELQSLTQAVENERHSISRTNRLCTKTFLLEHSPSGRKNLRLTDVVKRFKEQLAEFECI